MRDNVILAAKYLGLANRTVDDLDDHPALPVMAEGEYVADLIACQLPS